jgi:hypothetical protein
VNSNKNGGKFHAEAERYVLWLLQRCKHRPTRKQTTRTQVIKSDTGTPIRINQSFPVDPAIFQKKFTGSSTARWQPEDRNRAVSNHGYDLFS